MKWSKFQNAIAGSGALRSTSASSWKPLRGEAVRLGGAQQVARVGAVAGDAALDPQLLERHVAARGGRG